MTRFEALMRQAAPRSRFAALMNQAVNKPKMTRRQALLKRTGVSKRMPVPYYNRKGRQFHLTLKGKYVIRANGKSLYGRKSTNPRAPPPIRPKRR
jgi:hypothetical protein